MKIYRVHYTMLSYDKGLPEGDHTVGYYANETVAQNKAAENPETFVSRAAEIETIEVEE